MEDRFRTVVEQIFNNWTGLQLAVEHSMGGSNSHQVALECVNYMAQFCLSEPNIQVSDIQEALEDIMDEEFDTICEDNSPTEIANLLHRFLLLLKEENTVQYELEYQKLPTRKPWLSRPQQAAPRAAEEGQGSCLQEATMDESSDDAAMDQDAEWTEVKSRRRK